MGVKSFDRYIPEQKKIKYKNMYEIEKINSRIHVTLDITLIDNTINIIYHKLLYNLKVIVLYTTHY